MAVAEPAIPRAYRWWRGRRRRCWPADRGTAMVPSRRWLGMKVGDQGHQRLRQHHQPWRLVRGGACPPHPTWRTEPAGRHGRAAPLAWCCGRIE